MDLFRSWYQFDVDYTHDVNVRFTTYVGNRPFLLEYCLSSNIPNTGVLHLPNNLSDHSTIYCIVQNEGILVQQQEINKLEPKPSWKRTPDDERYDF